MRKTSRRLALSKETLNKLDGFGLQHAEGALKAPPTEPYSLCAPYTCDTSCCPTYMGCNMTGTCASCEN